MTASLPDFEADAQAALTAELAIKVQTWMENFVDLVHERVRAYAARNDYDTESVIDSVGDVTTEVESGRVHATVEWQHKAVSLWEFGVEPHEIRARDAEVLSFVWHDPPAWVREEFDQARDVQGRFASGYRVFFQSVEWGSDSGGIPASRAIRDSLNGLRALLQS